MSVGISNGQHVDTEAYAPTPNGGQAQSKIEKFGWTIQNRPGEFEWINKSKLDIDPEYQREASEKKVIAIASQWDWVACGTLSVAIRGRRYFVFDGGHRCMAARKRTDIKDLPCMVYTLRGVHDEAAGFLATNSLRKPVTAIEKFNAMVKTGVPVAVRLREMLDVAGYRAALSSTGRCLRCIRQATDCLKANETAFERIWPLILDIADGGPIGDRLVDSIFYIETHLPAGQTLAKNPWRGKLTRLGAAGIREAASRAAAYHACGGAAVWAAGVVNAINHGNRTHRLELAK